MDELAHVLQWIAIIVGATVAIVTGLHLRSTDASQQGLLHKHEFQIQTLWDFIGRRSLVEALKGVIDMNSPIVLKENARPKFNKIAAPLLSWYFKEGRQLDHNPESVDMKYVRDLYIMTEHEFGDRLVADVCAPHHMSFGECIWGAIALMREGWNERFAKADSDKEEDTQHDIKE